MKRIRLNAFLFLSLACLVFGASVWARVGPLTWNSSVSESGFYYSVQPATHVVSRFTPAQAIVVTRIEVQAAVGSQQLISAPLGFQRISCTVPMSFKVTDGEQSFTLPLPSAATVVTESYNPSSADSGPLDLAFPAGAKIVLTVIQGDQPDPNRHTSGCFAGEVNITVQYEVNSPEHTSEERPRQKEGQK